MMKKLVVLSVLLNLGALGYIFFVKSNPTAAGTPTAQGIPKSVYIISPAVHPSLEKIEQGVIKSLTESGIPFKTTSLNANGQKQLLLAQTQEAVSANPDIIVTIGKNATQLTQETLKKRGSKTPHIFAAVSGPKESGLDYNPHGFTGVVEQCDYALSAQMIAYLAPQVKSVLLVYDPTQGGGLQGEKEALQQALQKRNIALAPLEIFNAHEIRPKASSMITAHNAIVVLKDNTTVASVDVLIKLCEEYKKPLIVHDLDSVDKGAALGFGSEEESYGIEAGKMAAQALKNPSASLPEMAPVSNVRVKVHAVGAEHQGLTLSPEQITLMRCGMAV